MTRRSKIWRVGVALFTFINAAGAGWALAEEEMLHATTHIGLLLLGAVAYLVWRLTVRANQQALAGPQAEGRIEYLQQSVDAIALEVERIGEAQRFNDRLRAGRAETPPLNKDQ